MTWIAFGLGIFIGVFAGIFVVALCQAAGGRMSEVGYQRSAVGGRRSND